MRLDRGPSWDVNSGDGSSAIVEYFWRVVVFVVATGEKKTNPPSECLSFQEYIQISLVSGREKFAVCCVSRDFLQQSWFGECDQDATATHHNCVPE